MNGCLKDQIEMAGSVRGTAKTDIVEEATLQKGLCPGYASRRIYVDGQRVFMAEAVGFARMVRYFFDSRYCLEASSRGEELKLSFTKEDGTQE